MTVRWFFPLFIIATVSLRGNGFAQMENAQWHGARSKLDFRSGHPLEDTNNLPDVLFITEQYGYSTICDRQTGEELFTSDGMYIWDRNGHFIANDPVIVTDLSAGASSWTCLITPRPGNAAQFYLFSAARIATNPPEFTTNFLLGAIVDMRQNGGLGGVFHRAIPIALTSAAGAEATWHRNGCDIWLLAHNENWNDNAFLSYLISPSGINPVPVVTRIGNSSFGENAGYASMRFSLSGDHLATILNHPVNPDQPEELALYRFNNQSGALSSYIHLGLMQRPDDAIFSPSDSFLYSTQNGYDPSSHPIPTYVVQYDLRSGDSATIANSGKIISFTQSWDTVGLFGMELGVDGKIYIGSGNKQVGVIEHPDSFGLACGYKRIQLTKFVPYVRLQNIIESPKNCPYHAGKCDSALMADFIGEPSSDCNGLCVQMKDRSTLPATSWHWSAPKGHPSVSTDQNPIFCFDTAGIYPVTLIASGPAGSDTITQVVRAAFPGQVQALKVMDTTIRGGDDVEIPINFTLPPGFAFPDSTYAHFDRLEIGLRVDESLFHLPVSEFVQRITLDTGLRVESVDSESHLLRIVISDTGNLTRYYGENAFNFPDMICHLGSYRFSSTTTRTDTATLKLAYLQIATTEESYSFCQGFENEYIARVAIQGTNGVTEKMTGSTWRVSPNPAASTDIEVEPPAKVDGKRVVLVLYDVLGRERLRKEAVASQMAPLLISSSLLENGNYYLRIEANNSVQTEKIEVRK